MAAGAIVKVTARLLFLGPRKIRVPLPAPVRTAKSVRQVIINLNQLSMREVPRLRVFLATPRDLDEQVLLDTLLRGPTLTDNQAAALQDGSCILVELLPERGLLPRGDRAAIPAGHQVLPADVVGFLVDRFRQIASFFGLLPTPEHDKRE